MLSLFITHLQGYKRQAVRSPVFITLEVICELILPLIMAEIVDVAIPAGDTAYIFRLGAVMLALSLLSMAFGVLSAKYATFASQGFGANLRQCLFDKVQEFSFADIDRFSSASLITRMTNDVNAMTMMLNMGLRMLVRAPVMLIAALGISISINPRLAVVLLVVIPLMILAIGILMKICTKLFEVMQTKIDGLNNTLQENLVAIRVVKAFVREDHERKKFQRSNDELMMAGLNVGMKVIAIMPIMMLAMNGATVAVLYLGGKMVMAEGFLLGDLQAFINYIFQILISVMMVAMALLQLTRAQACAHRINEVLSAEPSVENKPQAQRPAQDELPAPRGRVEFRDVSFKYARAGTGDDVLSQISFTVEPGQFVAIVGGTGTGKSSLVNLIPRFYDVAGGAVLLDGLDVRDYPLEQLRDRIGMVLQNNVLFTGTIRENLLWGRPDATEEEMWEALETAQAADFVRAMPDGLDSELSQNGKNLSGGQRQRMTIARALVRKPEVLILDDAASALDYATGAALNKALRNTDFAPTVITVSQRVAAIRNADTIVVLDEGEIVGIGTNDELLRSCEVYREIFDSQLEKEDA